MQILGASSHLPDNSGPFSLGIGIFDGVHIGHRQLLTRVRELAAQEKIRSLAYTFDPHPAMILSPEHAPKLIEPLNDRVERIDELGLDAILIEPFSQDFAALGASDFVRAVLVQKLNARHVVVGRNFTFGRKAAGNVRLLSDLGRQLGFEVHSFDLVQTGGAVVS
jgi:riboflavin kinase/FMN adenylyltransferase